jgi:glycogen debranching enzyme
VSGWSFEGSPPHGGTDSRVTLVEGACFCISTGNGDIEGDGPQGLFYRDTRFLSRWSLEVNGAGVEVLNVESTEPFAATFVTRARPPSGRADSTLLVVRRRFVGNGMREDLVFRNLSNEEAAITASLQVYADFAHLFEVKEGWLAARSPTSVEVAPDEIRFLGARLEHPRELTVRASEPLGGHGEGFATQRVISPRDEWLVSFQLELASDGFRATPPFSSAQPLRHSDPAIRLHSWRRGAPSISAESDSLVRVMATAVEDLGSLRIFDPEVPELVMVAAGSPWFMTLFGRDSLLTSSMTLLVDPSLAAGTLTVLADLQGSKEDPNTEEQPGRILHEVRWGAPLFEGLGDVYYGTIDATPLFVMLLAEAHRWGASRSFIDAMLPHADLALRWIEESGDRDGDGFVEYRRLSDRGLLHQGWKDSFDGITYASGLLAEPPLALCEVQGYVYAAYLGRAELAEHLGDDAVAWAMRRKAARLKQAFNKAFWLPERGWFALALDGDKQPVDALASNLGHCLWAGIVDDDKAPLLAEHLMGPAMFTGWGVRTLASSMGAFNPMSYHNGSVWPHDSAIAAAGLMRYGFAGAAQSIALGLLQAAEPFNGRLPELFCGFDRRAFVAPVSYPTSCSPQAWAAASVFSLLRTLFGFEPDLPRHELHLSPHLPEELGRVRIENIPLGDFRLTIEGVGDRVSVEGVPDGLQVVTGSPRQRSLYS